MRSPRDEKTYEERRPGYKTKRKSGRERESTVGSAIERRRAGRGKTREGAAVREGEKREKEREAKGKERAFLLVMS